MAVEINAQNFDQEILKANKPAIIDVYASWCGPCRMVSPIFEELSNELKASYTFGKINIDNERDLAIQFNVSSVPTFLFINNGSLVGKESGYMNKETLKSKIESYFKN
jgi:thioredoxin 1